MENNSSIGLYNAVDSAKNDQINEKIPIPYLKVYNDRIVLYPRIDDFATCRKPNGRSLDNLKRKKYQGNLSITQKRKIKQKLTAWINSIRYYNEMTYRKYRRKDHFPIFITLTLSDKQKHDDKFIRRNMLDLFIKNLKNRFDVKYYFWRAECQENGNIHYHIITDKYCRHQDIRDIWNRIQKRYGYLDNYFEKHGHLDANSTDVKGIYQVNNFVNYVIKYALKSDNNRKIQGKVYGMSDCLNELNVYQDLLDSSFSDILVQMQNSNSATVYNNEHFTVIIFNKEFYGSHLHKKLEIRQYNYYYEMYRNLYESKIEMKKVIPKRIEQEKKQVVQLKLFSLKDKISSYNHYNYIKSFSVKN